MKYNLSEIRKMTDEEIRITFDKKIAELYYTTSNDTLGKTKTLNKIYSLKQVQEERQNLK